VLFTEDHAKYHNRACGNLDPGAASGVLCCMSKSQTGATEGKPVGTAGEDGPGLLTWDGDALHGMYLNLPQPADYLSWNGGLRQGERAPDVVIDPDPYTR
jgi:hypothetical protein